MGKSVLTPEEILLGKAFHAALTGSVLTTGEREFGQNSETGSWGNRGCKAVDNGGSRVV
jgi:hypothetical protein